MAIDHIYISHYTKLADRKEYMEKQLKDFGLDKYPITWLTWFDREAITQPMIRQNYRYRPDVLPRPLCLAEIANAIAHNYAIKQAATKHKITLIIEDDMILKKGFLNILESTHLPENWDFINVGGCCFGDERDRMFPEDTVLKPVTNISTGCYLLNSRSAQKITEHQLYCPFSGPIDYSLTLVTQNIGMKIYQFHPTLGYEGSKFGVFEPSATARGF